MIWLMTITRLQKVGIEPEIDAPLNYCRALCPLIQRTMGSQHRQCEPIVLHRGVYCRTGSCLLLDTPYITYLSPGSLMHYET
jgi:hypothetical protein